MTNQMKKYLLKRRVAFTVTPIKVEKVIKEKTHKLSESQKLAKMLSAEICGLSPYERKAIEYIRNDNIKKARKYLKIKLGSLVRAEKKLDLLLKTYR